MRIKALLIGLSILAFAAVSFCVASREVSAAPPPGASGYKVIKTVPLGGEGGWDYVYVDSSARRVYISRGTHTMVMDADTYALVGDIPDTQGVHGIAIASELRRGFTSNGRSNDVTIFDLKTLKPIGRSKPTEIPTLSRTIPSASECSRLTAAGKTRPRSTRRTAPLRAP